MTKKELLDPNKPPYNKHICLICGGFGPIKEHCHKIPPNFISFPDLSLETLEEWIKDFHNEKIN